MTTDKGFTCQKRCLHEENREFTYELLYKSLISNSETLAKEILSSYLYYRYTQNSKNWSSPFADDNAVFTISRRDECEATNKKSHTTSKHLVRQVKN